MKRDVLGDWGAELSDLDYAKALAALGVIESRGTKQHRPSSDPQKVCEAIQQELEGGLRTPLWRWAHLGGLDPKKYWTDTIHTNVAALAQGWDLALQKATHPRKLPRLAIDLDPGNELYDIDGLMEALSSVEAQALVLTPHERTMEQRHTPPWHFPVQVGVPEQAAPLWGALKKIEAIVDWVQITSSLRRVGGARDACDLLILPAGMAERLASEKDTRLLARFVICLDHRGDWGGPWSKAYGRVMELLGADGIAVVEQLDGMPLGNFYVGVLRELSHDLPAHAAVWRAGLQHLEKPPFILGYPDSLDRLRVMDLAKRLDAEAPNVKGMVNLSAFVERRPFMSEGVDAVPLVSEVRSKTEAISVRRRARYLQAEARRPDKPESFAKSIAPERPNLLSILIGPTEKARRDAYFDDSRIDYSNGDVKLDILLEMTGALVSEIPQDARYSMERHGQRTREEIWRHLQPLTATAAEREEKNPKHYVGAATTSVVLRETGNSGMADFVIQPLAVATKLKGRVTAIHNNRVVQTARVSVEVAADPEAGSGVTLSSLAMHSSTYGCIERRVGDVLLIVSDDRVRGLRIRIPGRKAPIDLRSLAGPILDIRAALETAADKCDSATPLHSQKALKGALIGLAANGAMLFDCLRNSLGGEIDQWERVQLLSLGTALFPIEAVYSGATPDLMQAELCPHGEQALLSGNCCVGAKPGDPPGNLPCCPYSVSNVHICPMKFWGFSKVIERCTDKGGSKAKPSPILDRQVFGEIHSVLYGVSSRAYNSFGSNSEKKRAIDRLDKALSTISSDLHKVDKWEDWRDAVKPSIANPPNLFMLLAHTQKYNFMDALEIGTGEFLGKQAIKPDIIGSSSSPKLLFLLGCSTVDPAVDFAPFPELFRFAGADIICACLAPIRGINNLAMACAAAEALSACLKSGREIAFGELLRDLRRTLFGNRHTEAFGLLGFGDGDWIFGG